MNLEEQLINAFKDKPISQRCLKKTNSPMLGVVDPGGENPCQLLEEEDENFGDAQFEIYNLNERELCFLAIDKCVIEKGSKRCDFAIFNENEFVFVELKGVISTSSETVKQRHDEARTQLESTIGIFSDKNINLSNYKRNLKLFAVVSVLDLNPPVTKRPVQAASQDAIIYAEEYMDIIWSDGHSYRFS